MKERILKLCKRLDKFSLEEIVSIAEDINECVLELLLQTLVAENLLIYRNDMYIYNKVKTVSINKKYSLLKYYPPKVLDIVIRCFGAGIPSEECSYIADLSQIQVQKLYRMFRELIYVRQITILKNKYTKEPQKYRTRTFFETQIFYFYIYDNQVFVVDKPLIASKEKVFTKDEIKEFKKIYCYLSRLECHNQNKNFLGYKLAESIWRRNRDFGELYYDLKKNLLNISS